MTRSRKPRGRRYKTREENKTIYIFSEGEKTEPLYFQALVNELKLSSIQVKINGTGHHTESLVQFAESNTPEIQQDEDENTRDEVWIVLDKDSFSDFEHSIETARSKGFKIAYSNECFELWYLLHFSKFNTPCNRNEYYRKLLVELKELNPSIKIESYRNRGKSIKNIYSLLKPFQADALRNADWLQTENAKINSGERIETQKPSTSVHELVKHLFDLKNHIDRR